MKAVWNFVERLLRGRRATAWLKRAGIDPARYWLLMDLFGQLSERRDVFGQLGRNSISMEGIFWAYLLLSGLMTIPFLLVQVAPDKYFTVFLGITGFLLLSILLPETSNSLINPVEGLVLAHQPVDGATYTAAKLSHLARLVLYIISGIAPIPAFAALLLKRCPWYYPALHIGAAFVLGLVLALFCCALFGLLLRFVAPARLKAVGFAAEMAPWMAYLLFQAVGQFDNHWWRAFGFLPTHGAALRAMEAALAVFAVAAVVFGIRSLSGDYLSRVAAIAQGRSGAPRGVRRSYLGALVARWFGGAPALAGYDYLARMMRRDWQFRRQMIPLIPLVVLPLAAARHGLRDSPFSGKFTLVHVLPHGIGVVFYMVCSMLVFGNDHKGAWLFLLAPMHAFRGFAAGVYARLLSFIAVVHLLLLVALAWFWGPRDAALFAAFSMAVAAVYLGLELRLIEGVPFAKQPEQSTNPFIFLTMIAGGLAIGIAVGLQYFLIFRSPLLVLGATLLLALAAWLVTRSSLAAFEGAIRFHLATMSQEAKALYAEVNL